MGLDCKPRQQHEGKMNYKFPTAEGAENFLRKNHKPNRRAPSDQGHIIAGDSISVAALVREHVGWG